MVFHGVPQRRVARTAYDIGIGARLKHLSDSGSILKLDGEVQNIIF